MYSSSFLNAVVAVFLIFSIQSYSQTLNNSKNKHSELKSSPRRALVKTMKNYKNAKQKLLRKGNVNQIQKLTLNKSFPVIAVKFKDTEKDPWPISEMQKQLFDGPWPTGTMREYFNDMSYGQFKLNGNVHGWYQISEKASFYETYDWKNKNMKFFLKEALDLADKEIDFTQYDNDGPDDIPNSGDDDGYVDAVFFINAANNIGEHFHEYRILFDKPYETNDIGNSGLPLQIDEYTMQKALEFDKSTMRGIGVFCHEFGHALGLPDLYDIDHSSSGIGNWGLMSYFGSTSRPLGMTAWSKYHLGWLQPNVIKTDQSIELKNSYSNKEAVILWREGNPGKEYFLLENRQKVGFDKKIRGSGLLIYHIDEEKFNFNNDGCGFDNYGNSDENHRGVDLLKAGGDPDFHSSATDPFPGTTNNVSFNRNTVPSSHDYNNEDTGISIENIKQDNGIISFDATISQKFLNAEITSPKLSLFNNFNILEIKGTANGTYFKEYSIFVGEGENPKTWKHISSSDTPIENGTLGYWTPGPISKESYFQIKLVNYDNNDSALAFQKVFVSHEYLPNWPQKVKGRIVSPSVVVADIDFDGKKEIIAGTSDIRSNETSLHVWNHLGESVEGWPIKIYSNKVYAPAIGDVNGDGKTEIFVNSANNVLGYNINGQILKGWPKSNRLLSSPVLTDLDDDKFLEVIVSDYIKNQIFVYDYKGNILTGWPQSVDDRPLSSPCTGDIDADGKKEVIVVTNEGRIYAWNNDGTIVENFPIVNNESNSDLINSPIIIVDVCDDFNQEIVCAIGKNIHVYNGNGNLIKKWPIDGDSYIRISINAGDINNDGVTEIIANTSENIYIWDGQGNNLSNWPLKQKLSYDITVPIIGDINGDGEIDIILIRDDKIYAFSNDAKSISGWPKKIPSQVDQQYTFRLIPYYSPVLTEVNNDGMLDVVLGAEDNLVIWTTPFDYIPENIKAGKWRMNFWNTGNLRDTMSEYPKPICDFIIKANGAYVGDKLDFTDNSIGYIERYTWDFGDSTFSFEQNPSHSYSWPGKYLVTLSVSGPGGTDVKTMEEFITIYDRPPSVAFEADTTTGLCPLTVKFIDKSTEKIDRWKWTFGDGNESTEQNPIHTYNFVDTFDVSLMVFGPGGNTYKKIKNYIKILENPPLAEFEADTLVGHNPLTVNFSDKSIGKIDSWKWIFGDGNESAEQNPTHTYNAVDTFDVSLIVVGPGGQDTIKSEDYIIVQLPVGIEDEFGTPTSYTLEQNYPNPFNPSTKIKYGLPERSNVSLSVYNMLGEKVITLKDEIQNAGFHTVIFDASKLTSGLYLYKIETANFTSVKKMLLIK